MDVNPKVPIYFSVSVDTLSLVFVEEILHGLSFKPGACLTSLYVTSWNDRSNDQRARPFGGRTRTGEGSVGRTSRLFVQI